MKASPIAIALALASVACTVPVARNTRPDVAGVVRAPTLPEGSSPSRTTPRRDTSYELLTPELTGLERVVDDGHRTYLSFASEPPLGLMIFDEDGKALSFSTVGKTAIIDGVRRGWLIRTPTRLSYAQTRTPKRVARLEETRADSSNPSDLPADLAAARAGVLSAEERLSGLSNEIERASRGEPSAPLSRLKGEIEEIQTEIDGIHATLVRTHFALGSALLVLSEDARGALIDAARRAESVQIQGGTDSTGSEAVNIRIALARAQAVRDVLVRGGVESGKLTTRPATRDYVATNATASGRAINRRVDVFFIGPSGEPIRVMSRDGAVPAQGQGGASPDRALAASQAASSEPGNSSDVD
jgi:outer membrane protein OmpA-like peptidoglycan-associated protein